jgi:hypothetical protein
VGDGPLPVGGGPITWSPVVAVPVAWDFLNFLYFSVCGVSGGLVLFVGVGGGVRSVGL